MISLTKALFRMFFRKPWTFLIMTIVSIGFAYIFSSVFQTGGMNQLDVPVIVEGEATIPSELIDDMERSTAYSIVWTDEEEMEDLLRDGKAELGVSMREDGFSIIVGVESPHISIVQQHVQQAYVDHAQTEYILEEGAKRTEKEREEIRDLFETSMNEALFTIESAQESNADADVDPMMYLSLFGMMVFFVIYTIAFNVIQIIVDKNERIWDRMIMSPLKKWEMYAAYIVFSFLLGYAQVVLILLVFRYIVGIPFHGHFTQAVLLLIPYVFAIVALSMFITGISKNVQQFNTIISIAAVCMAMIGGAFWPLEIVSSSFMLTLSKFVPITYAIDLLEGTVVYGKSFGDLFYPVSVLILMGVVLIGLGIHMIEKRQV